VKELLYFCKNIGSFNFLHLGDLANLWSFKFIVINET